MVKKIITYFVLFFVGILTLFFLSMTLLYCSADMKEPELTIDSLDYRVERFAQYSKCNDSYLRRNKCGLMEARLVGSAVERGASIGALMKDELEYQEQVFVDKIREFIPSDSYLSFLRAMLIIFNRHLGEMVPLEFREEIFAISNFCSHQFDAIGTPYERQLNYHAAHDIGHAMQQYMLVGCSSFAVWGDKSADSTLLVGRNFDFYMGDEFAKNKLVMFVKPTHGYQFASVGWPGMIGVLSGMNEKGLSVTINAAKGTIPTSAATPISILAREILQYAATIEEAYAIAQKRETFVSESLLIASANDGCAVVIEKTPEMIDLYKVTGSQIVSTNHYNSEQLSKTADNIENIATSDSQYRYDRLTELLSEKTTIDYREAVEILRNRYGAEGKDLGIGNEMTLNQSIAHHAVVFQPEKLLLWVSTEPWQSGQFVCYDLKTIFAGGDFTSEITTDSLEVAADTLFLNNDYLRLMAYREKVKIIKQQMKLNKTLESDFINSFEMLNPNFYYTYQLLGDYYANCGEQMKSKEYYKKTLMMEIPQKEKKSEIEKLLNK